MSATDEWGRMRIERKSGRITKGAWVAWAEKWVKGLPEGPFRSHCEAHIRFVKRT